MSLLFVSLFAAFVGLSSGWSPGRRLVEEAELVLTQTVTGPYPDIGEDYPIPIILDDDGSQDGL